MRHYELLLEYDRNITIKNLGSKLSASATKKHDSTTDPNKILEVLEEIDPTKNKQYVLWLIRQYINNKFRLEDESRINDFLTNYHSIKQRLPIEQRDINRFDLHQLEDLVDSIFNPKQELEQSNTGFPVVPNSKVLYNGPLGQLAIPETKEASCELGSGTKWCTAAKKNNAFNFYNEAPLYIWHDKNGKKYQFYFSQPFQLMDSQDRPIDKQTLDYFRTKHPVLSKLFKEIENKSLNHPLSAYSYAKNVIKGRWLEAEPIIMKNPEWACNYATYVIKGRWLEAEPIIMKNPYSAYWYTRDVIKGRWREAEKYIMKDPQWACNYASDVIKGRWPEAEPYIMKDPKWARRYRTLFQIFNILK